MMETNSYQAIRRVAFVSGTYTIMINILFILQGIGALLPWNVIITAREYYRYKYQADPSIKLKFENAFSVAALVPNTIGTLITIYLTGRVARTPRVILSLLVIGVSLIVTTVFVYMDTSSWTGLFYGITLTLIAIINFSTGIYQVTMLGIGSACGPKSIHSINLGMASGGMIIAFLNILTLAVTPDIRRSAMAYFCTAAVAIFACIIGFMTLISKRIVRERLDNNPETDPLLPVPLGDQCEITKPTREELWHVFKLIYPHAFSVFFVFFIQVCLMPGVISNIHSMNAKNQSKWTNQYYSAFVCFLLFNSGNICGVVVSGVSPCFRVGGRALHVCNILRTIFIPLFMLCNYQPRVYLPVVFQSDVFPIIFVSVFGFTSGYIQTLCMVHGPQVVEDKYKEIAGVMMQVFLTLGMPIGAVFSYVIVECI